MKKLKFAVVVLMFLLAVVPAFAKNNKKSNKTEIINYQGKSLGKEIPNWVENLMEGDKARLEKSLKLYEKKVFIIENNGPNLDALKNWKDSLDVDKEIAAQLQRLASEAIETFMWQEQADNIEKIQSAMDASSALFENVKLNGIERKVSFWIKTQSLKPGVKRAKNPEDLIIDHSFFVIYDCNMESYENQINELLKNLSVEEEKAEQLKQALLEKLSETISIGKSLSAN